MQLVYF